MEQHLKPLRSTPVGLLEFADDRQVRDKPEANGWLRHPEAMLTPTAGCSQNHQCRWSLSPSEFWFKEGRYEETDKVYLKPGGEEHEQGHHFFSLFSLFHKTLYCCDPQSTSWGTAYTWPWNCLNSVPPWWWYKEGLWSICECILSFVTFSHHIYDRWGNFTSGQLPWVKKIYSILCLCQTKTLCALWQMYWIWFYGIITTSFDQWAQRLRRVHSCKHRHI